MSLSHSQRRLVAGRYVSAIFPMAVTAKKDAALLKELESFGEMIDSSDALNRFMNNPSITRDTKTAALEDVLKNAKASPLMRKFMALLAKENRLNIFREVVDIYKKTLAKHLDQLPVIVTSAEPLKKPTLTKIQKMVQEALGRDVQLESREDASILGGLTLTVGSMFYDYSVAGRLHHVQQQLKTAITG